MTFQPGDRLVSRKADWGALGTIHVELQNGGPLTFTMIITEPPSANRVTEPNPAEVIVRPRRGTLDYDAYRRVGSAAAVACTRFRRHRVRCFYGTGGESWKDEGLHASSSLRLCG
jgi:hypothetical protein